MGGLGIFSKSAEESWNFTIQDRGKYDETHIKTNDDLGLGRALGGSSTVTFLQYTHGSKHDYNRWAKVVNDPIWNWDNVLPYLKKSQRLEDPKLIKTDGEFFGQSGNIGLTLDREQEPISLDLYTNIFKELGNDIVPSMNGNISLGYTYPIFTSSKGVRQHTALGYLTPKKHYKNLHILKHSFVKKIIIDANKNAVGVEALICNKRHVILKARKEVIVTAGIVNTPKLLMLSGIGPHKELCKHKISTISDLPVGEGFQNHIVIPLLFNFTKKVVPFRPFNPCKYSSKILCGYVALNKSNDYPDYRVDVHIGYPKATGMPYCTHGFLLEDYICNNLIGTSVNSHMMYAVIYKQDFKSFGRILLKSNYYGDDPLVFSGYYSVKKDIEEHARYLQDYFKIQESKTFKDLGGEFKDPKLPQCGKMINNLKYWKCYVQYMIISYHQYSSTCQMGKVVDSRLRVYGVKKLRVADSSIMPNGPSGGTLGATIMIGEKAADIIKEDNYNSQ